MQVQVYPLLLLVVRIRWTSDRLQIDLGMLYLLGMLSLLGILRHYHLRHYHLRHGYHFRFRSTAILSSGLSA